MRLRSLSIDPEQLGTNSFCDYLSGVGLDWEKPAKTA